MNQDTSGGLLQTLRLQAEASRLNAIDEVLQGRGIGPSNFEAEWKGYDTQGRPRVIVGGKQYNLSVNASSGRPAGSKVYVRAGYKVGFATWR
jgi:hypothetical protein